MRTIGVYMLGLFVVLGSLSILMVLGGGVILSIAYVIAKLPLAVLVGIAVCVCVLWFLGDMPYEVGSSVLARRKR